MYEKGTSPGMHTANLHFILIIIEMIFDSLKSVNYVMNKCVIRVYVVNCWWKYPHDDETILFVYLLKSQSF